eukprot:CAMPEP_0197684716 /NCGR_PEP_ID=MMETSP1338-20131121/99873_1 /TAXON_ID=43686 ORGANISM="Pelagodinium beii, Strain RCC1491" /NCGR_SAMPLE_ID=MMETSP1338 /ASSEMBLY_ACC=CAM_ASM_000754 /LENGTH=31 /DNA_ID= /DNA_START= /DNA_END= /DNA_ORIENTATION=
MQVHEVLCRHGEQAQGDSEVPKPPRPPEADP